MKIKWNQFSGRLQQAILSHPVEFCISAFFLIICILDYKRIIDIKDFGSTFPICFFSIYAINHMVSGSKYKWLYYFSVLLLPGFWFWHISFISYAYLISLIVSQLLILLSCCTTQSDGFVKNGLTYARDVVIGLMMATVVFLLSIAIFSSIIYIFDLNNRFLTDYIVYSSFCSYILIGPVIFMMFNTYGKTTFESNRFFHVLVNYIFSPALLIYTAILYLYFIKILIQWELPKGGLSYMGISFILAMLCIKALQPILKRRYFDWFYDYFSWWTFPALCMLWVSILYRVDQYGFTEARIYLMIAACLVTLAIGCFFVRRFQNYTALTLIAFIVLSLFTFIPPFSAGSIAVYSQVNRFRQAKAALELFGEESGIVNMPVDSQRLSLYHTLYGASSYIFRHEDKHFMQEHIGFSTPDSLFGDIIPSQLRETILGIKNRGSKLYLGYNWATALNIQGYRLLDKVMNYVTDRLPYSRLSSDGNLYIYQNEEKIFETDINAWFNEQLDKLNLQPARDLTEEQLAPYLSRLIILDTENRRFIFNRLVYDKETRQVVNVDVGFMLTK